MLAQAGLTLLLLGVHLVLSARQLIPHANFLFSVPGTHGPAEAYGFLLLGTLAPALGEELLFRGYLLRGLATQWKPWAAIIATSLLAAIWHGWPRMVPAIPAWIFLGWIALRSGSTLPALVLHAATNACLLVAFASQGGYWRWAAGQKNGTVLLLFVLGCASFLLGTHLLTSRNAARSRTASDEAAPHPM